MHLIILIVHIVVALSLIGLILIQHGKGADAGAAALGGGGGGASSSLFGSQGSSSFLSTSSAVLATVFFFTSLSLAYFSNTVEKADSVTQIETVTETVKQAPPADLPDLP